MQCLVVTGSALLIMLLGGFTSDARAAVLITVDKSAQTLTVARDGRTLYSWKASTGRPSYRTPSGKFTAFRMEAKHFSKEWDNAPMPHSIFFTNNGHAIHGTYDVKRLGRPASHGCVRLSPANAALLFALVEREGLPNTRVVLTGSERIALARLSGKGAASGARTQDDEVLRRERQETDLLPAPTPFGQPFSQQFNPESQAVRYGD